MQAIFQRQPSFSSALGIRHKKPGRVLPAVAIAVAFLAVGYVFSEPLYSKGAATSVAQICGRALDRTQAWLHRSDQDQPAPPAVQMAEDDNPQPAFSRRGVSRIRVTPVRDPYQNTPSVPAPAATPTTRRRNSVAERATLARRRRGSDSRQPENAGAERDHAQRGGSHHPVLLAALEPVELSEDLSRRLLLQQVLPSYPEKAVRERLQGPVVLQAFIARDGTIQDLKLIRGSFLLGQAAYRAVRQWRYQPYLINGRAVEAQTLVTVDFKLP